MKIRVIVNPKAGAGAAARKVPHITRDLDAIAIPHEIVATKHPGDATALARSAREDGIDTIIVVGGDGTVNEVVQAYVDAEGNAVPGPQLGIIPAGTGGDFRRVLGLERDTSAAIRHMFSRTGRAFDMGVVTLRSPNGRSVRRAFVNVASCGVSGRIDRLVNDSPKWVGGRAAFALGTIRALATYRNVPVTIDVDGVRSFEGHVVVVAVANGQYFGGGMQIAPEADPTDGLFDVVVVGDLNFRQAVWAVPSLYTGAHVNHRAVRLLRGRRVEIRAAGNHAVEIDTDGEAPGTLPMTVEILPKALSIRA